MKRNLIIELLEENGTVSFYSPKFEGEQCTEFENFLLAYKDTYREDISTIIARMERIKDDGENDRHIRWEGKKRDRLAALPGHIDTSSLRLYCICISSRIMILGNGGPKTTATYNADPLLTKCVETLQKIDFVIQHKQDYHHLTIDGCQLIGDLSLFIKD